MKLEGPEDALQADISPFTCNCLHEPPWVRDKL